MNRFLIFACLVLAVACSRPSPGEAPAPVESADAQTTATVVPHRRPHPSPPPTPAAPDPRTPEQLAQAACTGGKCKGTVAGKRLVGASTVQPIIPPSWTVTQWYVDPSNVTACAADSNSGTAATCSGGCTGSVCASGVGPIRTYAELAQQRWGTYAPRLRQNTTITFLSGSNATDPVYLTPLLENAAIFTLTGALGPAQLKASGTFTGTVARNRATPQLQQETLASGLAAGELLVDTTHSGTCFLATNTTGNAWTLTQPLTPHVIPDSLLSATEVTTFADGDAFAVYSPVNVFLVNFSPTIADGQAVLAGPSGFVSHVNLWAGANGGQVVFGQGVGIYESSTDSAGVGLTRAGTCNTSNLDGLSNVYSRSWTAVSNACINETSGVLGGALLGFDVSLGASGGANVLLDQDVIVGSLVNFVGQAFVGDAYVATSSTLTFNVGSNTVAPATASAIVWGPGTLNALSRVKYPAGASGGTSAFLLTGGIKIAGKTTACITQPGASAVGACNQASASGANLDSANGATSGCLGSPGAELCNF